jgi:hypothetical protein
MRATVAIAGLLAATALALGACGDGASGGPGTATASTSSFSIVLYPSGRDSTARKTWAFQCDPDQGTLPAPKAACDALFADTDPLAPPADDLVCAELYGGRQVIEVTGLRRGDPVRAVFTRANSCQIEAFDRIVAALGLENEVPRG